MGSITNIAGVPSLIVESETDLNNFDLLVDVRGEDEYLGELGHIHGAKLITQGEDLDQFLKSENKKRKILFICRSGARSERATIQAKASGFSNVVNMVGGMLGWNDKKFKTEK